LKKVSPKKIVGQAAQKKKKTQGVAVKIVLPPRELKELKVCLNSVDGPNLRLPEGRSEKHSIVIN